MDETWECVVIGGGAAGLSAALVLGRARRRTLLVDAEPTGDGFTVLLLDGRQARTRRILLAMGTTYDVAQDFGLPVPAWPEWKERVDV